MDTNKIRKYQLVQDLINWRRANRLTKKEAAKILRVDRMIVSRLEAGKIKLSNYVAYRIYLVVHLGGE